MTDLGNFFDIPGIDSILRSAISDTVASMMVLPERYVLKLADDVDISKLLFPMPKVNYSFIAIALQMSPCYLPEGRAISLSYVIKLRSMTSLLYNKQLN